MDANGIDFVCFLATIFWITALNSNVALVQMVLSCSSPCIQGISDPEVAQEMSVKANNELARQISNNTLRFGAFAALSMHNATLAAQELNRTVKDLGFLGALINDYQESGSDNGKLSSRAGLQRPHTSQPQPPYSIMTSRSTTCSGRWSRI
jgi:hypothetical protein